MFQIFTSNVGLSTVVHRVVFGPAQYLHLNGLFGCLKGLYCLIVGGLGKIPSIYLHKRNQHNPMGIHHFHEVENWFEFVQYYR